MVLQKLTMLSTLYHNVCKQLFGVALVLINQIRVNIANDFVYLIRFNSIKNNSN